MVVKTRDGMNLRIVIVKLYNSLLLNCFIYMIYAFVSLVFHAIDSAETHMTFHSLDSAARVKSFQYIHIYIYIYIQYIHIYIMLLELCVFRFNSELLGSVVFSSAIFVKTMNVQYASSIGRDVLSNYARFFVDD